jgi:hypothetical protein
MGKKILVLAGAPEERDLSFNCPGLLNSFSEDFSRFAASNLPTLPTSKQASSVSGPQHAVWRSISLSKAYLSTGISQRHDPEVFSVFPAASKGFFTTVDDHDASRDLGGEDSTSEAVLSEFYEDSLARGDGTFASQGPEEDTTSFMTDETVSQSDTQGESQARSAVMIPGLQQGLSDLEDLPNAAYIEKIQPETITVNLIVGIISIAAPRMVKTRWGSKTIIEVVVGDDTRSGFTITFWLPSDAVDKSILAGLRSQDIVLMQNIALNSFQKKVYGGSLRRNLTRVHLLHRRKLDPTDKGGLFSTKALSSSSRGNVQLQKTVRVKDWVLKFVRSQTTTVARKGRTWDEPPPHDTQ